MGEYRSRYNGTSIIPSWLLPGLMEEVKVAKSTHNFKRCNELQDEITTMFPPDSTVSRNIKRTLGEFYESTLNAYESHKKGLVAKNSELCTFFTNGATDYYKAIVAGEKQIQELGEKIAELKAYSAARGTRRRLAERLLHYENFYSSGAEGHPRYYK